MAKSTRAGKGWLAMAVYTIAQYRVRPQGVGKVKRAIEEFVHVCRPTDQLLDRVHSQSKPVKRFEAAHCPETDGQFARDWMRDNRAICLPRTKRSAIRKRRPDPSLAKRGRLGMTGQTEPPRSLGAKGNPKLLVRVAGKRETPIVNLQKVFVGSRRTIKIKP
jgi:hypothetical protein